MCIIQLFESEMLSVFLKMENIEYGPVIKFFLKGGSTRSEIYLRFVKVYGDFSPLFSTVQKGAGEFKRGRTCLEGDPREGRPKRQQHRQPSKK